MLLGFSAIKVIPINELEFTHVFSVKNIHFYIFCLQIVSESATWVFSCKLNMLAMRRDQ